MTSEDGSKSELWLSFWVDFMGILDSKLGDDTDEAKDGINGFSFLNFDGERTLCDNFGDILVILEDEPEDEVSRPLEGQKSTS